MQFDPENYPVADYKFDASSTLGIIAREYEVTQLVQLLQTMKQDSPLYPVLVQSIIDNMNLSNREELIAAMEQASQPNPQAQQAQQMQLEAQMAFQAAQTAALQGQAQESQARAQKIAVEAQTIPQELEIDKLKAITTNIKAGNDDDKEFERRLKIADMLIKEKQVSLQEQSMTARKMKDESSSQMEQQLMQRLMPNER
jgi:formaldehyde-activating enzyme involved in methanogenesis